MATLPGAKISDLAKATNITDSDELELRQGGNKALSWALIKSFLSAAIVTWDNITGKPSTFPPSAHIHAIADVTGLQTALNAKRDTSAVASSVYITDGSGNQAVGTWATTATAGTFARRNSDGTLTVSTPVNASDAATKGYSDALNTEVNRRLMGGAFNNVMSDSGRMSGRENPLSYLCNNAFDNTYMMRFFALFNGGTAWAEIGKYIYDNTTNGGTRGNLTQTTIDLQTKLGRTGALARYGIEYYIAQRVSGIGTSAPGPAGATDKYLFSTNSSIALFASNKKGTVSFWVRCIDGTSIAFQSSNGNVRQVYKNGILTTGVQFVTVAEGWAHIRIVADTSSGYDNAYPQMYAEPSQTVQIALPAWFTGEIDTGIHASPIPHQTLWNELDNAYVKTSGNEVVGGVKTWTGNQFYDVGTQNQYWNTADKLTNTESAIFRWNANAFQITTLRTGTGVDRPLNLQSVINLTLASFPLVTIGYQDATTSVGVHNRVYGNYVATSGVVTSFEVSPLINQSDTAGYTIFSINPSHTAVGSGPKILQNWSVGGSYRATLDTDGYFIPFSIGWACLNNSSSATLTRGSEKSQFCNVTASSLIKTLPAAAGCRGKVFLFKKMDSSANTVTIKAAGAELIDGANTKVLTSQYQFCTIQSNGTVWCIIG